MSWFKHPGSLLDESEKLEHELFTREGRTLDRNEQVERLLGARHLSLAVEASCYGACSGNKLRHAVHMSCPSSCFGKDVLFGLKPGLVLTSSRCQSRLRTSCLGEMLGVRLCDRHNMHRIRPSVVV